MHVLLILAVLLAMTLAEHAPQTPLEAPLWRLWLVLASMLAAPGVAAMVSAVVVRGIQRDARSWAAWLERFTLSQRLHAGLWLGLVLLVTYVLGWPQLVRENWRLGGWILLDDLLILAPVYVPLLLSWAAFYEVDRAVQLLTAEDQRQAQAFPSRWQYVALHARHYLALVTVPLLIVLGLHDTARWIAPELVAGPYGWLIMGSPLAVLVLLLPQLLASLWQTERLAEGPLRTRLEQALLSCRLRVRDILIWKTSGRMVNAAVTGLLPSTRYVFLTDGLLEKLNDDQIEAVLRHEAGHVACRHLLWRMLLLGAPLAVSLALQQAAPEWLRQVSEALAGLGVSAAWQTGLMLPALMASYGLIALGWYCKQLEFEADLFACRLLERCSAADQTAATQAFVEALETITVATGSDRRQESWLHPSIARRRAFIVLALDNPIHANAFRRRLRWLAWLIAGTYLLSFGWSALPI